MSGSDVLDRSNGVVVVLIRSVPHFKSLTSWSASMNRVKRNVFTLRKRSFLNPVSTGHTSYVLAEVESSSHGDYRWGSNLLTIADCEQRIRLEFFLGTKAARRLSLRKIDLLLDVLTRFRECLAKESALIEKGKRGGPTGKTKA